MALPAPVPGARAPPANSFAAPHTEATGMPTRHRSANSHLFEKPPTKASCASHFACPSGEIWHCLTTTEQASSWEPTALLRRGQACGAPAHAVEARSTAALEAVPQRPALVQAQALALLWGQEPLEPLLAGIVAARTMKYRFLAHF